MEPNIFRAIATLEMSICYGILEVLESRGSLLSSCICYLTMQAMRIFSMNSNIVEKPSIGTLSQSST